MPWQPLPSSRLETHSRSMLGERGAMAVLSITSVYFLSWRDSQNQQRECSGGETSLSHTVMKFSIVVLAEYIYVALVIFSKMNVLIYSYHLK